MYVHATTGFCLFFHLRFLNRFTANSALHKEMLAVLAAITEVIKSNGGAETHTEYFGALVRNKQYICKYKHYKLQICLFTSVAFVLNR